jgi:hypothetical protein
MFPPFVPPFPSGTYTGIASALEQRFANAGFERTGVSYVCSLAAIVFSGTAIGFVS